MKSKRAKEYLDRKSPTRIHPISGGVTYSLLSRLDAEKAIDIAEQEVEERIRTELLRWHDPKEELPKENTCVLCKVDGCVYTKFLVLNYFNGKWWFYIARSKSNVFEDDANRWREFEDTVIGWREIQDE